MTKRLWQQRYKWTDERLAAAAPRDPAAARLAKPPQVTRVTYPFSRDEVLREHVGADAAASARQGQSSIALQLHSTLLDFADWRCCLSARGYFTSAPPCSAVPCPATLQYRNPWGQVRIGRILEDLDSLAGFVAYEHWWVAWLGGWLGWAGRVGGWLVWW